MVYTYDGTFDGFLTVVFEIYASKQKPVRIVREKDWQATFFDTVTQVDTDIAKSTRVWKGFTARVELNISRMFYLAFASDLPDVEMVMYRYLENVFADTTGLYHKNLLDEDVFELRNFSRKVNKEIYRFYGFVRFQQTSDGLLFSAIDPDHDIVSFLSAHFSKRYAGQSWVIYDTRRDKGIYYDTREVREVRFTDEQFDRITGDIRDEIRSEDEEHYKRLWKAYYKATHIPERKNTRLMLHFLPRRYWKYLPEKNGNA